MSSRTGESRLCTADELQAHLGLRGVDGMVLAIWQPFIVLCFCFSSDDLKDCSFTSDWRDRRWADLTLNWGML